MEPLPDSVHLRKVFWAKSSWFRSLPVPALLQAVPWGGSRAGGTRAVPEPACAGCEQTPTGWCLWETPQAPQGLSPSTPGCAFPFLLISQ